MDKENVKGKANELKGNLRKAVGHATGDEQQVAQGDAEVTKGKAQGVVGDVKSAARKVGDTLKGVVDAADDATRPADRPAR
jgi:uncharacterized protein YjbJ (UPF0337 family)